MRNALSSITMTAFHIGSCCISCRPGILCSARPRFCCEYCLILQHCKCCFDCWRCGSCEHVKSVQAFCVILQCSVQCLDRITDTIQHQSASRAAHLSITHMWYAPQLSHKKGQLTNSGHHHTQGITNDQTVLLCSCRITRIAVLQLNTQATQVLGFPMLCCQPPEKQEQHLQGC